MNPKDSINRLSRRYHAIISKRSRFHLHHHYFNQLEREPVVERKIILELLKDDMLREVLECLITRSVREMVQRNGRGRGLQHIENECMKRKLKELLALTVRNQYRVMKVQIKQIDIQSSKEEVDKAKSELQGKVYPHIERSKQTAVHNSILKKESWKNVPQLSARLKKTNNNCATSPLKKDVGTQVVEILKIGRKLKE